MWDVEAKERVSHNMTIIMMMKMSIDTWVDIDVTCDAACVLAVPDGLS